MPNGENRKGDYLYLSIYKELKNEILQGAYREGDSFPPERLLKERFGTTHVTVRNALSLLVEEGYIERYSGKGTIVVFSGKIEEELEQQPIGLSSVHFIISTMEYFYMELLKELSRECVSLNTELLVSVYDGDALLEKSLVRKALSVEGSLLIYEPSVQGLLGWHHKSMSGRTLLLNSPDPELGLPEIHQNYIQGGRDSIAFMKRLGYAEIAFVGWERTYRGVRLLEGYLQGLASLDLSAPTTLQANGMGLREGGYDACQRIMKTHPACRAFLCANDLSAGGVMNCLEDAGFSAGEGCTVIGCGNHPFAEVLELSSLDLNISRIKQIFRTLLAEYTERGEIGQAIYEIKTELVLRKYSRC